LGKALAQVLKAPRATPASASLVTYNPFLAAYCDAPWISNVIYCGQDDWATGEGLEPWWDAYRDAYRRMDERGATIFAVSQELAARISVRAQVVPNGVNPDVWRPVHRAPPRIAELPRPRAVYSGTVDSRLHMDLVQRTARAVGSLITVGTYPDGSISDQLRSIDNVHMFDKVGQVELAATVQACDLGLIPHRNQAGIRAMSPIKLYEYLAGGLPVVSVDLPPVHGVDDERVAISPPEGWDDALTRALAMDRADESARQSFIDEVAWASRMQPVIDAAVA
jgi:glycosyltransferase involved in cell wall biosynthesis